MVSSGDQDSQESQPNPLDEQEVEKEREEISPNELKTVTVSQYELNQLKKNADEYKDKYLRSIAEAENLRKRLHKERQEMTQLALQSIIVDFINPIDHLENALAFSGNMGDEVKNWAIGFKMILNQFKEVLASNDVHPFKSVGMPFDPHSHEAVEMIETTEYAPGIVVEESIKGYKMGSKTIRPARVKVAKAPKSPHSSEQSKAESHEQNEESEINNQ